MADKASNGATVIPAMQYRDAPAIEWLCTAFGFERHLIVPGENGTIAHAQLVCGNGMIMVGSVKDSEYVSCCGIRATSVVRPRRSMW